MFALYLRPLVPLDSLPFSCSVGGRLLTRSFTCVYGSVFWLYVVIRCSVVVGVISDGKIASGTEWCGGISRLDSKII